MTLRGITITAVLGMVVCVATATSAVAQTNSNRFGVGTTLAAFGGGTADADGVSPAAGLELGWEIVPRLGIEGAALWSAPGDGRHEFSALLGPKFNLAHGQRRVPFLSVAAGLYRATFAEGAAPVPPFYAARMTSPVAGPSTFDDFVAAFGGGVDLYAHSHWAIRPDVRLLMIAGGSDLRWVTTVGVHVAYHFEHHHIAD